MLTEEESIKIKYLIHCLENLKDNQIYGHELEVPCWNEEDTLPLVDTLINFLEDLQEKYKEPLVGIRSVN